ncbi:hypothetical protein U0070_005983 [Myodes glareolus]|uniref:Uncharacterized protein n=1 Tax=Myodes glareolus TaxID=447135 RepID=A0AAW0HLC6_MYOGA
MVLTLSISQAKTGAAQAGDPLNRNPRSWEPCKAAVKWGMGSGKDFLLSLIPASTGLPGPVQFWLQRPASPPGEGLHGTPVSWLKPGGGLTSRGENHLLFFLVLIQKMPADSKSILATESEERTHVVWWDPGEGGVPWNGAEGDFQNRYLG